MAIVVITGGTGLIGSALTHRLHAAGHTVRILSRSNLLRDPNVFQWNPDQRIMDRTAFEGADCLVHLAGESSFAKPLTPKRKQELRNSRINSLSFLLEILKSGDIPVKTLVSASAIGYYGATTSDIPCMEDEHAYGDFWGTLCSDWENEALRFQDAGIRTVILRTALVLTHKGGFLQPLLTLAKLGGATVLGSGRQHLPWIHIDDLCSMYQEAIEHEALKGVYNAVAPEDQTNRSFIKQLASYVNAPTLLPYAPSWCIRLVLRERAALLLEGRPVSSQKIVDTGFAFRFPDLAAALR